VDSLSEHLHSSQGSFLESKKKLEVREDELSVARSTIAALEARNLELERRSASHDKELFEALKRQEVLEARSSEYDQLRSAVDAGQVKIDELTSDVLRLDMVNSELRGEMADLRARLARATQAESELSGRSSWLQGVVDEQKGQIAGFKAEVSNLSRNLRSVEVERSSRGRSWTMFRSILPRYKNEMVALRKENDRSFVSRKGCHRCGKSPHVEASGGEREGKKVQAPTRCGPHSQEPHLDPWVRVGAGDPSSDGDG
jgi:chromosome segregation ATPase